MWWLRGAANRDKMPMGPRDDGAREAPGTRRQGMSQTRERGPQGVGFTEYVLIVALVAVIVIGVLVLLGPTLANLITMLTGKFFTP